MSTFYAVLPGAIEAQRMMRHLIDDGIPLDDMSVVSRSRKDLEGAAPLSTGDSSYFVGRADDPSHDLIDESTPDADYEATEVSNIGGGISTSDTDTDVDSVDQMEDSQYAAEDEGYPRDDTSQGQHQHDSLNLAVNTGFPTPVTPIDNDFASDSEPDRALEGVKIKGVGFVFGGGDLATAAFDWGGKNGNTDGSAVLTYLQDEGVPPREANDMFANFENGSAILAVGLDTGIDEDALEEVAERYGAVSTGWYGAPRY